MKKCIALLLLLALLAGCGKVQDPAPSQDTNQDTDQPQSDGTEDSKTDTTGTAAALGSLASFTATAADGGSFSQDDIAAKDVTVVNFWSLTCAPCIAEMPDLAAFAGALPDNVQVVTVCLDGSLDLERTRSILAEVNHS